MLPIIKQFVMNLICGGEGGIPLFLEMADGNQDDKTKFAHLFEEFQKQWTFEGVHIADSALYTADNLKWMEQLKWVTRVPLTLAQAKQVLVEVSEDELVDSCLKGYSIAERTSDQWQKLYYQHQQQYIRKRLDTIKLLKQGNNRFQVCQEVGCSYDTLTSWMDKYLSEGLKGLVRVD